MSEGVDVMEKLQDAFYKKELQSFLDSYVVSSEDIKNGKPDRNISGLDAVTHSQEVSLSDRHQPAGEMIYNHQS